MRKTMSQIVTRKNMAEQLRTLADEVADLYGRFQSADPDLRDTLLGMVDSLYCKSFPDEEGEPENFDDEE